MKQILLILGLLFIAGWGAFHSGVVASSGSSFTPLDIPDLELWLDASDESTITESSGAVSQWDDKSGNGNHATQGTESAQPTTGTRTVGGKNCLDFLGGDFLSLTSEISYTGAFTVFIVGAVDADTATKTFIGSTSSSGPEFRASNNENLQWVRNDSAVLLTGGTALGDGTAYILSGQSQTSGNEIWINGVSDGSNETDPNYLQEITRIGGNDSGSTNTLNGAFCDGLIFSRALTNAEMNQIGAYLADKWGLSWTDI